MSDPHAPSTVPHPPQQAHTLHPQQAGHAVHAQPSAQPHAPGHPLHSPDHHAPAHGTLPKISSIPSMITPIHDSAPISLVGEDETEVGAKIRAFGVADSISRQTQFKRQPLANGTGAVRLRTFHGRLSDEGLAFLDEKVNQWLDAHPEIEIKHVTSTVGIYDGKLKEPALIMNVWY